MQETKKEDEAGVKKSGATVDAKVADADEVATPGLGLSLGAAAAIKDIKSMGDEARDRRVAAARTPGLTDSLTSSTQFYGNAVDTVDTAHDFGSDFGKVDTTLRLKSEEP